MLLPLCAFFAGYRVVFDEGARVFDEPNSRLETEFPPQGPDAGG